ncbi:polyprotein [Elysia marginata]|uniref:Polyprotein n=1 Tax=Elysia marginata TaxID=1093978 RepID=A0AAV4JZ07_9GAST|nr:polyprotein [Elysia marginata]
MDSILQEIPNVCVYFDNLYITGKDDSEHLQTLKKVLRVVSDKGLKINKDKCQFMMSEINFLGHRLSRDGLKPQYEKVKTIKEAPKPENEQELKAFLGLINYFRKFIGKRLVLTCNASPNGLGAILSHIDENGDRPIAYASRSLNQAEKNYSQLDREGLGVIFGVKKFHKFLYGRKFTIFTDHKPLLGLFGEHKSLPEHASPRVQRWAITLAAYDYELKYKPGSEMSADGLSRLPIKEQTCCYVPEDIEMLFSIVDNSCVNVDDVRRETHKDECLMKVYE